MGIRDAVLQMVDALRDQVEPVTPVEEVEEVEEEEYLEEQPIEYSGFVIVRLVGGPLGDASWVPDAESRLSDEARRRGFENLASILEWFGVEGTRLIQGVSPEEVWAFEYPDVPFPERSEDEPRSDEREESEDWDQPVDEEEQPAEEELDQAQEWPTGPASLNLYWRIDMRENERSPEELVRGLEALGPDGGVSLAYREMQVGLAQVNPQNDPRFGEQLYLRPAPEGIDVQAAWGRLAAGQAISNVGFADIEKDWYQGHRDFPGWLPNVNPVAGVRLGSVDARNHGASVLGIIMAVDNNFDIVGAAPGLPQGQIRLASVYDGANENNVADAITTVIQHGNMVAGDVLLIEVERCYGRPVELDCADFAAIYRAVQQGIIVVEAAGNGNIPLDSEYQNFSCSFEEVVGARDSGAILVGASHSRVEDRNHPAGHRRWTSNPNASNYGRRVNCYAWGEGVLTLKIADGVDDFSATSAAAAIIAGVVILVQSFWKASHGGVPLSPTEMRNRLSDPNNGTPQYPTASESQSNQLKAIGSMPSLARVLASLGL